MTKIYIPRDMAALAMGAKRVLAAVQKEIAARGLDVEIVRNGSRGMLWLSRWSRWRRPPAASAMVR